MFSTKFGDKKSKKYYITTILYFSSFKFSIQPNPFRWMNTQLDNQCI